MAFTQYQSCLLEPSAGDTPVTQTQTINFGDPSNPGQLLELDVFVMCYLVQVNSPPGAGGFGVSQCWISGFVQSGTPKTGYWQILNLDKVSSVTFSAQAVSASIQAVGLIFTK